MGSISLARQGLVGLMQRVNFGRLEGLCVREGEPVLSPMPRVVRVIVFGKENGPHLARSSSNFALKSTVVELFDIFDRDQSVDIETLEIQGGLPVRMTVVGGLRVA